MKSKHRLNANDDDHQKARMSRVANTNLRNRNIVDTVDKYAAKVSSPDGVLNDIMIEKTIFSVGSGLPPMKYTDYSEMVDKVKHAFPNWICTMEVMELKKDGTVLCKTQHNFGCMQDNLPAISPFPSCKLSDCAEEAKTGAGVVFPEEVGIFRFSDDGTKIIEAKYSSRLGDANGATTMSIDPKVGLLALYKAIGRPGAIPVCCPSPVLLTHKCSKCTIS